ncbi:calmodulin-like protein 12 [Lytechinus variegatus]|uniref:calmodulin-like protein 12 n=1 Tax=Lytechinus variegatus TaxID=7654 RepID=UPI001BB1DE7D|nr:calmodulin-like protein 12 [Lytechinus variegatus]
MSLFLHRYPALKRDIDLLVIQLRGIYRLHDVNEDGHLDEIEFISAAPSESPSKQSPNHEDAFVLFETFDKNRDARLSFKEVMDTVRSIGSTTLTPIEAIHQFGLIDVDQDGILSFDEFYRSLEVLPQSSTAASEEQ